MSLLDLAKAIAELNSEGDRMRAEIARLTAEVERLMEQLRLTQIDWNNVATENASLQAVVDAARALKEFESGVNDDDVQRETLILDVTEAVCALDGEP